MNTTRDAAPRELLPREHGLYGVLLFPLATALLGAGGAAAWLLAAAMAGGVLAHKALLIHVGVRPARDQLRRRAGRCLLGSGAALSLVLVAAVGLAPHAARCALIAPVAGGVGLIALAVAGADRGLAGHVAAALVLPSCALPVALAGGDEAGRALASWATWASGFVAIALAVRAMLWRERARLGRALTLGLVFSTTAAAVVAARAGGMPLAAAMAAGPLGAVAAAVAAAPPHPRNLKRVGWSTVVASTLTLALLSAGRVT